VPQGKKLDSMGDSLFLYVLLIFKKLVVKRVKSAFGYHCLPVARLAAFVLIALDTSSYVEQLQFHNASPVSFQYHAVTDIFFTSGNENDFDEEQCCF